MNRVLCMLMMVALLAFGGVAGAQTRTWLDRDRIALGESATLNIETDAGAAPDYAPLLPDFDLAGQSSREQVSWVNGVVSRSSLYAVTLRPRRDGLLHIPALRVGGRMTTPLTLLVTAAAAVADGGSSDVFIQSEADAQSPYVQQSVGWVVRLYSAVPLIAGQLDQPEPAGASLQRVGEDVQYRRSVGSRSYVVTERRFLLIPERSGELVIPPARFEGRGSGNAFDQLFGDGQTALHAVARPRVLQVRAIPANAPQPWLPLHALTMRYLVQPTRARAGSAVDVVVEAVADGATASQLPDLAIAGVDGAQVFPEHARPEESIVEGRPRVRLQRRFSIVPARAGTLVLPGPRIDWWDDRAGAARTTALPPITLRVAPGVASAAQPGDPAGEGASASTMPHPTRWPFAVAGLLALLLIGAGLAWRARSGIAARVPRVQSPPLPRSSLPPPLPAASTGAVAADTNAPGALAGAPTPPAAIRVHSADAAERAVDLASALASGDLGGVEAALRHLSGGADLDAVIARLDDPAQRQAVDSLRRARWAGGDAVAALASLRAAFSAGPRWRQPAASRDGMLPPLYPDR